VLVGGIVYLVVNRRRRTLAPATDGSSGVEEPVDSERAID
jgi:hypothetical protein